MSMTQALLQEFDAEAKTTRRVLERVPTDKLTWKPHPKSMSLGALALHVAAAGIDRSDSRRPRREREEGEGDHPGDRRRRDAEELDRQGRRPDADDDAEIGADARAGDEPLGTSSRPALRLPPPPRRPGAVDLRPERRREPVRRPHVIPDRRRRLDACAAALALAVLLIGLVWNTRVAAGADAYGYVSQADLWLRGDLHIDQSFAAGLPWPSARLTLLPLGYRAEGSRIVPQYPPGLPLLMAAAKLAAGQCAMFWVVPICGAALVLATYAIGARIERPAIGLAAAWIVATSPTLLFMLMAPMSDVPAAAAWAVAVACALGGTRSSAAMAGAAAALGILIRPNLAPIAGAIALWLALGQGAGRRRI